MHQEYKLLSNHFFTFYVILPIIIYFPAFLFASYNGGGWWAHWFVDIYVTSDAVLNVFLINLFFGVSFYLLFRDRYVTLEDNKNLFGIISSVGCSLFFASFLHFPVAYFKLLFFVLMFVSLKKSWVLLSYALLSCVAISELVLYGGRWAIIFCLVIFTAGIKYGTVKSLLIVVFGLILSVIVLNPIKHGIYDLKLDVFETVNTISGHLSPIYMAAQFFYEEDFSNIDVLSESLPLGKSLTGSGGLIKAAENAVDLPDQADFGSSSSSINDVFGFLWCVLFVIAIKFINKIKFINEVVFFYFISMGPMFFRRSLLNLINDVIVIIAFASTIYFIFYFLVKYFPRRFKR